MLQAVDDARAAAADRDRGRAPRPTRTSSARAWRGWPPRTRRCAIEQNAETHQIVLWAWARRTPTWCSTGSGNRYGVARRPGRAAGAAARDVRRHRRKGTAGTSSSPAATASTPSATSRSSRCRQGPGFEFVDKVVGGAVPRQFIPSVEKGVRAQMERGVGAGLPGRRHPGDPASTARRTASTPRTWPSRWPAALALREAAAATRGRACSSRSTRSSVLVPDDLVGTVMSDLSGRRGRVLGTEHGRRRPHRGATPRCRRWRSPATRSTCARSRTAPASFTRTFARYEPMPDNVAAAGGGRVRGLGQPVGERTA